MSAQESPPQTSASPQHLHELVHTAFPLMEFTIQRGISWDHRGKGVPYVALKSYIKLELEIDGAESRHGVVGVQTTVRPSESRPDGSGSGEVTVGVELSHRGGEPLDWAIHCLTRATWSRLWGVGGLAHRIAKSRDFVCDTIRPSMKRLGLGHEPLRWLDERMSPITELEP